MAEKRLIDANELEEKAIYITGPKGSACHAVPLGLIQAARPSTRKRCDQRRTSSVDMYQKPKTVCSAMAAIIALAGSTVLTLSGISSIAPIAGTDLRTERRKKRESFNCLRGIAGSL